MNKLWDGAEFFRMMVANEKAVGDWYRKLAEDTRIGGKFFENMAQDEDRHGKIFAKLLERFQVSDRLKVEVDPEHQEYLDTLMKDVIENDNRRMVEKIAKIQTKDDVFALAESIERDSVMLVEEIRDLYPDVAAEEIAIVLKEEKKHLHMVMTRRMQSQMSNLKL